MELAPGEGGKGDRVVRKGRRAMMITDFQGTKGRSKRKGSKTFRFVPSFQSRCLACLEMWLPVPYCFALASLSPTVLLPPPLQLSPLAYHQRRDVESMEKQHSPTLKGDCLEKEGPAEVQRKPVH